MRAIQIRRTALGAVLSGLFVAAALAGAIPAQAGHEHLTISNIGSSGDDGVRHEQAKPLRADPAPSAAKETFKPHVNVRTPPAVKAKTSAAAPNLSVKLKTPSHSGPALNDQLLGPMTVNLVLEQYLPDPGQYQPEGIPNAVYCRKVPQGGAADEVVFKVRNAGSKKSKATTARVTFENGVVVDLNAVALPPGTAMVHEVDIPPGCYGPGESACLFTMVADAAEHQGETSELDNSDSSLCLQPAG